jgi:predicted 2-oxoglutarate/Fe(II)-dependent dioxygenase YbiX
MVFIEMNKFEVKKMSMVNGIFAGEVSPDSTICGCVEIFKNLWPNPEETIKMANESCSGHDASAYWERAGTIGRGVEQRHRTNKILAITNHAKNNNVPALQNIHNQFNLMLLATTIPYSIRHGLEENLWHEHYYMLRYDKNEEYKPHYDSSTAVGRVISAICYLNDDYEGGELEFVNFGVKIKPERGTLILFPSNFAYRHIAHPVNKGSKYALVTWIKDRD